MTAPKQEAKKVIDSLPEDTSYDEILKELAFDRIYYPWGVIYK